MRHNFASETYTSAVRYSSSLRSGRYSRYSASIWARNSSLALPLRDVELTVRLKGRVFHDLPQDLRRRTAPRHLADLVVRHLDAEPAVFALEQNPLDELVGDLVLQLLLVFATQAPAAAPARFLDRVLERRLELGGAHDLAVDLEDDVTTAAEDVGHLAVSQPADERDGHDDEHRLIDHAHGAHHRT